MAGIGFELKKLFQKRGLAATAKAYGYAGVIFQFPFISCKYSEFCESIVRAFASNSEYSIPDICSIILRSNSLSSFHAPINAIVGINKSIAVIGSGGS